MNDFYGEFYGDKMPLNVTDESKLYMTIQTWFDFPKPNVCSSQTSTTKYAFFENFSAEKVVPGFNNFLRQIIPRLGNINSKEFNTCRKIKQIS